MAQSGAGSADPARSKAINALMALLEVTPPELRDTAPLRDITVPQTEWAAHGTHFFTQMYGETGAGVQRARHGRPAEAAETHEAAVAQGWPPRRGHG